LAALDRAGIASGVLLSMAYTFASPRSTTAAADVAALTRRENAYNVAAARQSGWRLKAFIGINPFWDGALDELHHWRREPGVTGLKLHLSNSRFDAQSALQLERLADVCAIANAAGWSIVIHARGDGDYAPVETARFIEQVLPSAAGALVQIAHAGGGGGIDEAMVEALALYADALEQGAAGTQGLVFDLAVVLVRDAADPHSAALIQRFVQLARRIGLQRFFMGSDWPSVVPPLEHNALSQAQLPFTEDEWRTVLNNRAPYMQEHLS
jgi:predicted TIM-barrel fold metal-dependent hydrolase